jgi:uncharacterized membrane protein YqjE
MDDIEEKPRDPWEIARRLGATVLAVLYNRLELLLVELQEERLRFFEALLLLAAIAAAGFFTLALAIAAIVVLTWNSFGVGGLLVLSAAGLAGTLLLYRRLSARLKDWALLSGTLGELKKDLECLEHK